MAKLNFTPYDQSFAANPYPVYARLRMHHPVFYSDEFACTFLTRYADIYSLLSDRRFGRTMDAVFSQDEIREVADEFGFTVGNFIRRPIEGLVSYHTKIEA